MWPISGYRNSATVPVKVMVPTANPTSRSLALITGAVATMAEFPQTAVPTPMSNASRGGRPSRRPTRSAKASATVMQSRMSPMAPPPIRATSAR